MRALFPNLGRGPFWLSSILLEFKCNSNFVSLHAESTSVERRI